jgi:2,5-diamino-6-(ribosylamino)-4(3H)-pyrimidinone 5'-phosphate reductase
MISVDGRIDWITPDIGLFYEVASRWKEDATLAGSDTIIKQEEGMPEEDEAAFEPPEKSSGDSRPLLVVPDSKGRVRNWHALRKAGYWRDVVVLCSHATPGTYLDHLKERYIEYIVAGDNYVDLKAALEELNARYGIGLVRVDSGGTLNGVLLRAGMVDEISVLINPSLVGGTSPRSFFRALDLNSPEGMIKLRLIHFENIKDDIIWLQYKVVQ